MKYLKNQHGSTLAIALMVLVIFTILGFGLFTLNTSASKQFENTEQKVQARHFAEMGLVHYKSNASIAIDLYNEKINEIKTERDKDLDDKIKEINAETESICGKLENDEFIEPININDPNYEIESVKCVTNTSYTLASITVNSKGKSIQGKDVIVGLDLSITLPGILALESKNTDSGKTGNTGNGVSNTPPAMPLPPENGINKDWPCTDKQCSAIVSNFTDVSNTVIKAKICNGNGNVKDLAKGNTLCIQKGNLLFEDSLIMNNFIVGGGNGLKLIVEKDFYIKGKFHIQNHACIAVQGNFTSLYPTSFGTHSYLTIYGDAHFKAVNLHQNSSISVKGDVYVNGVKLANNPYSTTPSASCSISDSGADTDTDTDASDGQIKGDLTASLITDGYRYY